MKNSPNPKYVIADNLNRAIAARETNPTAFARSIKLDQKTIWGLVNPDESAAMPTIRTLQAVADGLNCELWQLLYENMPLELMGSANLRELLALFAEVSNETRDQILTLARERAEFERLKKENERLKGS